MKHAIAIALLLVSTRARADDTCKVCLETPDPVSTLTQGKGGNLPPDESEHVSRPPKPLFTGALFYALDDGEKQPLPRGSGATFAVDPSKSHRLRILGEKQSWAKLEFKCSGPGVRVFFAAADFYSPGWKVYPLPNRKTCAWEKKRAPK